MPIDTFANRLKKALVMNNMKPIELSIKTGIDKSLISNYLSGNYKAKQDKLAIIGNILGVSPVWLMGYDVPIKDNKEKPNQENLLEEYQNILDKDNILTNDQKKYLMNFLIEKYQENNK